MRNTTEGLYIVKNDEGNFKAVNVGFMNNFTMDNCSRDVGQAKAWIQEVSRYSPL